MINKIENEVDFLNEKISNFLLKKSPDATKEEHIRAIQKYAPSLPQKEYEILIHNINLMQKMELEEIAFIEFKRFGEAIPFSEYSKNIEESLKDSEQYILRTQYLEILNKVFKKYENSEKKEKEENFKEVPKIIKKHLFSITNHNINEKTLQYSHLLFIEEYLKENNPYKQKVNGVFKYGVAHKGTIQISKQVTSMLDLLGEKNNQEDKLNKFINTQSSKLFKESRNIINSQHNKYKM